jgi:hypothetical protein
MTEGDPPTPVRGEDGSARAAPSPRAAPVAPDRLARDAATSTARTGPTPPTRAPWHAVSVTQQPHRPAAARSAPPSVASGSASTPIRRRLGSLLQPPASPDAPLPALLALFAAAFLAFSILNLGHHADLDYYVPLADAFLHGRLFVLDHPSWLNELVPFGGHYYVVYPPVPAVLLMPLVLVFGPTLDQARVSIGLGAIDVALAGAVAYRVVGPRRWIWLLFAVLFGFGTTLWYSVQSGNSWHFAHVCATFFLLLAILDTQRDGPPWRIGLLLGGATLSRLPTVLAVPFFLAYFAWRADRQRRAGPAGATFGALRGREGTIRSARLDWSRLVLDAGTFGLALAIPLLAYGAYNVARFGEPSQEGYNLIPGLMQEYQYRYGFLAVQSIGRNLFAMLLQVPKQVDTFPFIQPRVLGGLSIFLTTPAFIWAFRAHGPTWFEVGAWVSILAIIVPIVLHADPGGAQFGYRYAIDFYPFAFLLMIHGMRGHLNAERRAAIILCFLVNAWGMWAVMTGWLA